MKNSIDAQNNFLKNNWKIPVVIISICGSIILIISYLIYGRFYLTYGADFLAYWSAGKIAFQEGYSEIYNLDYLFDVQYQELVSLEIFSPSDDSRFLIMPAAYFSFFVLPFQLFHQMDPIQGFWLWTVLNFLFLIGYIVFFIRNVSPNKSSEQQILKFIFLILFSFPVLISFFAGQVNVFLLICMGELIRNTLEKKTFLAGIWLGGLLVKPQLLILIIPIIFILRYWKFVLGFLTSSGTILLISLALSGFEGIQSLIGLWIGYDENILSSNALSMINWQMVGLNLDYLFQISHEQIIYYVGVILTLMSLFLLFRQSPSLGDNIWILKFLGILTATIGITPHAHHHMAMVLIPFLIYSSIYNYLNKNGIFLWFTVIPIVWITMMLVGASNNIVNIAVAFSGFLLNQILLFSALRSIKTRL